jgi:methylenetetrahydrofolate dehydrogenase (NADP+)/methenyltetrahydrofolate cyclohydrolase
MYDKTRYNKKGKKMKETLILKGQPVAEKNKSFCLEMINTNKIEPHLFAIIASNDPASQYYMDSIRKQSLKHNVGLTVMKCEEDIQTDEILNEIKYQNHNQKYHGIMVQKPLPKHIETDIIEQTINPEKDLDGFHALNAGLMLYEKECFIPCTAQAIIEIMDHYEISADGKHVVVVGRSNVVGKPVANLLLYKAKNRNATVTVCHSRTPNLANFTKQADILITAVGIPFLIKPEMIKEGVIIIDAGINEIKNENNDIKYVGDVDFEACKEKCTAITPVPGGVGSVTTSILFKHLCLAALKHQ